MTTVNWNPSAKELRKFGLTLLIGFGILGGFFVWRAKTTAACWLFGAGGGIGLWAICFPRFALSFYRIWMGIGVCIGAVTSRVVMSVIFFCVVTPVAIFFRLRGRDALRLKKSRPDQSYWVDHPKNFDESYYKHLF